MYSLKSVKDTIYWLSNDYAINLSHDDKQYIIKADTEDDHFSKVFLTTLNDYSLRDLITQETKDIKTLVVTKAFYPDLIHFNTIGNFDDPVNMDNNETK